jgi:TRAP-type C4-dicarboxylate transport system permease small subunit
MMTQPTALFRTFFNFLNRLEELFLCLLLITMIGLTCTQILLRDIFSTGFVWADPLLRYMVIWAGLFGADIATRKNKHIAIDIISHLIPPRLEAWRLALIHLFSATVCSGLTYAAVVFIQNEAAFDGGREILGIPSWGMNLAFPLAFGLITLRFLILFGADLLAIAGKKETAIPPTRNP